MKVLYRKRKGGISAPVLAILTFAVLLVVGVAILMYFYVLAPQATQQANLAVIGEPIITKTNVNGTEYYTLTVTIKNMGTDDANINNVQIVVGGTTYDAHDWHPQSIISGNSSTVTANWTTSFTLNAGTLYTIVLQTSYGNFEFQAAYRE